MDIKGTGLSVALKSCQVGSVTKTRAKRAVATRRISGKGGAAYPAWTARGPDLGENASPDSAGASLSHVNHPNPDTPNHGASLVASRASPSAAPTA